MSLRLFEITEQLKSLELLADSEDIPPEVIADTLAGLQGDFEVKAVQVAKFVLTLNASAEAIHSAADAMRTRAERIEKRAESIKHYLLLQFQITDQRKIETTELTISRRTNPVAVQVTDEHAVPPIYWVQPEPQPPRLDKKAIKAALQAGERVDGCFLESGERVEIRL